MGGLRAAVLGGTFDPPHLGHVVLAAAARRALALDRVLVVPAGDPWRKTDRAISAAEARVRMVRAAVSPLPWAEVSTIEVERGGPSYSAETMAELAADGGEWWFMLGADALADLPRWHEPAALLAAARLAVAARTGEGVDVPPALRRLAPDVESRIDAVPMPALDVSSSDLRQRVRVGRPVVVLLPAGVRRVIDELGLYRD